MKLQRGTEDHEPVHPVGILMPENVDSESKKKDLRSIKHESKKLKLMSKSGDPEVVSPGARTADLSPESERRNRHDLLLGFKKTLKQRRQQLKGQN
jgi:hypothetical protein